MGLLEIKKSDLDALDTTRKKAIRDKVAAGELTLSVLPEVQNDAVDIATANTTVAPLGEGTVQSEDNSSTVPVSMVEDTAKVESEDTLLTPAVKKDEVLDNPDASLWAKAKRTAGIAADNVVNLAASVVPLPLPDAEISDSPYTLRATANREIDAVGEDDADFQTLKLVKQMSDTRIGLGDDDANMETFMENAHNLVVDKLGYKNVGVDNGKLVAEDKEGKRVNLDATWWKDMMASVRGDKGEIYDAMLGATAGAKATKGGFKKKFLGSVAGGVAGATMGNMTDQLMANLATGEKLSWGQRAGEVGKAVALDATGAVAAPLVIKGATKFAKAGYAVPKWASEKIYKHIVNGNLDGAKKILKSDLGVDDKYMQEALDSAMSWQKEVVDGEINLLANAKNIVGAKDKKTALAQLGEDVVDNLGNAQAKEELLATAMAHPQGVSMVEGALNANPKGALELQKSIDARVKQSYEALDAATGTEVKGAVKSYEGRVKKQYKDMRETFSKAFENSEYRFDLDDLNIEESISDMGSRIGDDHTRKQFEAMSSAVKAQIEGKRAGAGVTRNIDDLLDLWQKMNKFYGKNGKNLDKPDAKVFVNIKKGISDEVNRALEEHTTPEIAKEMRRYFDDARDAYAEMYSTKSTKLYKSLMAEGKNATKRVDALVKHARDDDGELQALLSKLSPEEAGRAEDAMLDAVLQKHTKGKHNELKSLDMSKALEDLEGLQPFLKSENSKQSIALLSDLHSKFRHDFALSKAIRGVKNGQTHAGIATTWQGKLEAHSAGKIFNYISTLIPVGANPKRLALQRHLASALKKSRTPLDMAKQMRRSEALSVNQRQELKELIKINNRALAAQNTKEAARVKEELQLFEQKVEKKRLDDVLEVQEFKKPALSELRAVEHLTEDDRFGSFAQLVRRIQDDSASEVDIKKYLGAKREAKGVEEREEIEKLSLLPYKYKDIDSEDVSVIKRVSEQVGDEDFNHKKVKRLIYDLEKNGVPRNLEYDRLYDDMRAFEKEREVVPDSATQTASTEKVLEAPLGADGVPLFAKGVDNLAAGGIAGVEIDEQGNVTLDAEKFILGLGGYTAAKALVKNPRAPKEIKDLVLFALEKAEKKVDDVKSNKEIK